MENGSDSPVAPSDPGPADSAAASDDAGSVPEPRDELDVLWAHVEERWDDSKAHDLFVQACFERQRLEVAAARYKAANADGARAAVADKRMQSVIFLATQALQEDRTPPPAKSNKWAVVVAIVICAASVAMFVYAVTR